MLVVDKLPYASTDEVTKGIEDALDELRPGLDRAGRRLRRSSGPRPTSTRRSTTSPARSSVVGGAARCCSLFALLLQLADGARRAWSRSACRSRSPALVIHLTGHDLQRGGPRRPGVALAAIVGDAIVNVEHSAGRLAGRGDDRRPTARRRATIVMARYARDRAARCCGPPVMFALALVPILLMDRLSGDCVLPADGRGLPAGGGRLAASWP